LIGRPPRDIRELRAIRDRGIELLDAAASASDPTAQAGKREEWARQCLELNDRYPNQAGGLGALWLAACWAPETTSGGSASRTLVESIRTVDLEPLVSGEERSGVRRSIVGPAELPPAIAKIPPAILERLRNHPDQPGAAEAATLVCLMTYGKRAESAPLASFDEAAKLITQHYADSPSIVNFCECLGFLSGGSPAWADRYEGNLQEILRKNRHRSVRCAASFALLVMLQSQVQRRQADPAAARLLASRAEVLCEQFLKDFDGKSTVDETGAWYPYRQIEEQECRLAATALDELRHRAIGMPAPEIVDVDLLNRPMKLSDFRGKIVLLSFWGTSCGPCMKMIPHERDLADQFRDKPFAIVGVNCDDDPQLAVKAEKTQQISWRSFRDSAKMGPSISQQWKNIGLPTVYVIDQTGQIRNRWVGAPSEETLSSAIDRLLTAVR
jgi:thiol-disulfide isomerase/thioredoxin